METENKNIPVENRPGSNLSGRVFGGLIVVIVGVILLAKQTGADIPGWLISWPMALIATGLYIGFRHAFRGPVWIVLLLVGTIFLINDIDPTLNLRHYVWPIVIIAVGLMIIFRPQHKMRGFHKKKWHNHPYGEPSTPSPESKIAGITEGSAHEDYIDSVTIFGGVKRNIFSKNFRGGEIVTIFGGSEINLTQADSPQRIELDITQIFGGAKLIVPPHWKIHSEDIVSIFGGVEDKRPALPEASYDSNKVLILKGTNIFGGIDIKSF